MLAAERRDNLLARLAADGKLVAKDLAASSGCPTTRCAATCASWRPPASASGYTAARFRRPRRVARLRRAGHRRTGQQATGRGARRPALIQPGWHRDPRRWDDDPAPWCGRCPPTSTCTVITHSPTVAVGARSTTGRSRCSCSEAGCSSTPQSRPARRPWRRRSASRADVFLLGVTGVHPDEGLTTGDADEAAMKRALAAARRRDLRARERREDRGCLALPGAPALRRRRRRDGRSPGRRHAAAAAQPGRGGPGCGCARSPTRLGPVTTGPLMTEVLPAAVSARELEVLGAVASTGRTPRSPPGSSSRPGRWRATSPRCCASSTYPTAGHSQLSLPRSSASPRPPSTSRTRSAACPRRLTSFVGRRAERAALAAALAEHRLVTSVGPGGAGKTRLAVAVAGDHPGDVCFVSLAAVRDPSLVGPAIAAAYGLGDLDPATAVRALVQRLATAETVLVLDSCEHVSEAMGILLERLLQACPRLVVHVTSRARLMVPFEWSFPVSGLSSEPVGEEPGDAVDLFLCRAAAGGADIGTRRPRAGATPVPLPRRDAAGHRAGGCPAGLPRPGRVGGRHG